MGKELSPAKVLLLAAHLAAKSAVGQLATLAVQNTYVLRQEILLRILLTYLPETVEPRVYTGFLHDISAGQLRPHTEADFELDTSTVDDLSDEHAAKRARKLRLLPLFAGKADMGNEGDTMSSFLHQRAYRINLEVGVLSQLPELLEPFFEQCPEVKLWAASTVFPLVRRNCEYHRDAIPKYTLLEFENLPDRTAAKYLLSESSGNDKAGRDLRGLIAPWLHNHLRWNKQKHGGNSAGLKCPGWEETREIILSWAAKSWTSTAAAINSWNGPQDVDFGANLAVTLEDDKIQYLQGGYATTAIACLYSTAESSIEALSSSYQICCSTHYRIGKTPPPYTLKEMMSEMSLLPVCDSKFTGDAKLATFMRHDLLHASNPLTSANTDSLKLVTALTVSAYISTSLGIPWSVRKAGDLVFLGDAREQKGELSKLLREVANHATRDDDEYWIRARDGILWLSHWGGQVDDLDRSVHGSGPLGMIPREYIETELLKSLLSKSRYSLSRAIYEDATQPPLATTALQDAVYHSALHAFDNASNPQKTRGGLKKCDEIIHSFPKLLTETSPLVKKVEALLKTSHALSEYRLVLKQGEPFSPVVLRVHSDPIIIIEKVLSQNPKAYTRLQEFLEIGDSMVNAGLTSSNSSAKRLVNTASETKRELFVVEKRIVAMCIEAALNEDDFETAYSFVVSRFGGSTTGEGTYDGVNPSDTWSWAAALKAGQYVRTERSQQPTHLGTASGNLEIRHLEQRIECLATALRAAPRVELQQILKTFRRCEEQLDSAIREEAANEAAWDVAGDLNALPGTFEPPMQRPTQPSRNMTATAAARQAEEAPMSLFDLSRATARIAQRNLTALSSLHAAPLEVGDERVAEEPLEPRARKRDQLREAATGTLVSGVGWLIGANVGGNAADDD